MTKPIFPATFANIRPPNSNYTYFEDIHHHPFLLQATGFELVNAGWLADLAMLAYANERTIHDTLVSSGLIGDGFEMEFLSRNTTQCFVIYNDDFVVVSMRGTEIDNFWGAFDDWLRNLEFRLVEDEESRGRVHEGFKKDIAEIWNDSNGMPGLKIHLQALLESGRRRLWITGHSLGAALATLAAQRAASDGRFAVQGVYTFGSPRVGDDQFRRNYDGLGLNVNTYRIVHGIDIAQKLFPGAEYVHVGQLKFIDEDGILRPGILPESALPELTEAQEVALRLYRALGPAGALVANEFGLTIPAPIADHAPIYYASYIWNNQ